MVRCPNCESVQIGFLVSPRPTSCYYCETTWLQDGNQQSSVRGPALTGTRFRHAGTSQNHSAYEEGGRNGQGVQPEADGESRRG